MTEFFIGAKLCFIVLRQQTSTIQAILSATPDTISKQMVKFTTGISLESIVVIEGVLQKPIEDVKTCSVSNVEIKLDKVFILAEAPNQLPFSLEDASRSADAVPKVYHVPSPLSMCHDEIRALSLMLYPHRKVNSL